MLTVGDIYSKLGLEAPQKFRERRIAENADLGTGYRRTGRTTDALISAVAKAQEGPVYIIAATSTEARMLEDEARRIASEVGIDPQAITGKACRRDPLRGLDQTRLVYDHFVMVRSRSAEERYPRESTQNPGMKEEPLDSVDLEWSRDLAKTYKYHSHEGWLMGETVGRLVKELDYFRHRAHATIEDIEELPEEERLPAALDCLQKIAGDLIE